MLQVGLVARLPGLCAVSISRPCELNSSSNSEVSKSLNGCCKAPRLLLSLHQPILNLSFLLSGQGDLQLRTATYVGAESLESDHFHHFTSQRYRDGHYVRLLRLVSASISSIPTGGVRRYLETKHIVRKPSSSTRAGYKFDRIRQSPGDYSTGLRRLALFHHRFQRHLWTQSLFQASHSQTNSLLR